MRAYIILLLFLLGGKLMGQPILRAVVPTRPVIEREAFTIQYVWEDAEKISNFHTTEFNGLRTVNGPISYKATIPTPNGVKQVQNFVYTVVAPNIGTYKIPVAMGSWKGRVIQSADGIIRVVSSREALVNAVEEDVNNDYFLKPGEDPEKKIAENLFVKVSVDRKDCFVGQPVLASYKLYSRLESRSDIIKNPGFYGFSVSDMINLQDRVKQTETVNGRSFDVHVVRQVQLYPMQTGKLFIDAMEIRNKVQFSRDNNSKKAEQEIAEGMLGPGGQGSANSETYENSISTEPISINVKPLPEKNKPTAYSGAVGKFSIEAAIKNDKLSRNETGFLEITIGGKGNFIQLNAPSIQWPNGIEGFEAAISDSLDKKQAPLEGRRQFRYAFTATGSGDFQIPAVVFHFFDPDSGKFRTVSTRSLSVQVENRDHKVGLPHTNEVKKKRALFRWWLLIIPLVLLPLVWVYLKRKTEMSSVSPSPERKQSIEELLLPASAMTGEKGNALYLFIRQTIWDYLKEKLDMSGSDMNKEWLARILLQHKIEKEAATELLAMLNYCDEVVFTGSEPSENPSDFYERVLELMKRIDRLLYSAYL
jgi:hypothetical protein